MYDYTLSMYVIRVCIGYKYMLHYDSVSLIVIYYIFFVNTIQM